MLPEWLLMSINIFQFYFLLGMKKPELIGLLNPMPRLGLISHLRHF